MDGLDKLAKILQDGETELWDMFYERIKARLGCGVDKNHPSIQRDVNRVLSLNGDVLPEKISDLLK